MFLVAEQKETQVDNTMLASQTPQAMASQINAILGVPDPVTGTSSNGWFGGYGCRWCAASCAWFTVIPFDASEGALKIADIFRAAGASVSVSNEGGISEVESGRGLQVSAYVV